MSFMARMNPDDVQKEVTKQNDDVYGDDSVVGGTGGGADPMIIDDVYKKVTGNELADDEGIDMAEEVRKDEDSILKDKPDSEDDEMEDKSPIDDEFSGMHVVGENEETEAEEQE